MQSDDHSDRRMLDIVREVLMAAEDLDQDRQESEIAESKLDLELLTDLSAEGFDVPAILERLITGAHRN